VSDLIAGFEPQKAPLGTHTTSVVSSATGSGLEITFLIMLVTLLAAGWFLWRARVTYPSDVATAGASWSHRPGADGDGGASADGGESPPPPSGPRASAAERDRAPVVDLSESDTRVVRRPAAPAGTAPGERQRVPEYDYRASGRTSVPSESDETQRLTRDDEDATRRIASADEDATRRVASADEDSTRRIASADEDSTRRMASVDADERRRGQRDDADETQRIARADTDETQRVARADTDETTRISDRGEDAPEPLVRRRRPEPDWMRDRGSDDAADEPLVWPREPPPAD
jgi:hypothetical protein